MQTEFNDRGYGHYSPMWICVDCAMLIANGDTSGMDHETEQRVTNPELDYLGDGGYWVIGNDTDPFSWNECDRCNSPLGGERMAANILFP